MFNLDGTRSACSLAAESLIQHSGLPFKPVRVNYGANDQLCAVLYRKDPRDDYLYLTAMAGISQPEPMYGPQSHDDARYHRDNPGYKPNPLGFVQRERIPPEGWHEILEVTPGSQLHLTGRRQETRGLVRRIREELTPRIAQLLEAFATESPLYPELWFEELLARDRLRKEVDGLSQTAGIQGVASNLAQSLGQRIGFKWLPGSNVEVGIYFYTGEDWKLCSSGPPLPGIVPKGNTIESDNFNAFSWVARSTRAVLIRPFPSQIWGRRLALTSTQLSAIAGQPSFRGMGIVVIPGLASNRYNPGLLVVIARNGEEVAPAHIFLLSRIAVTLSRYLVPLLPIPGFPWWPNAKLERGGASVIWSEEPWTEEVESRLAQEFAEQLMPRNARVHIRPIRFGQSGARVYRLNVEDERRVREIPRVLKVGNAEHIANELKNYFRYVHNKPVGWHSSLDTARCREANWDTETCAAIAYKFVGPAETAEPWTTWAQETPRGEITSALKQLFSQLSCWYRRSREPVDQPSTAALLLRNLTNGGLERIGGDFVGPSKEEVGAVLKRLLAIPTEVRPSTCIVHGDLHSGNVFSLLDTDGDGRRVRTGVALIDWGMVSSGRHPLSDIAKLMVDVHYSVRWERHGSRNSREEERLWAWGLVEAWGQMLGCEARDWRLAIIHFVAKMLFYRETGPSERGSSYLRQSAREAAWRDLQQLAEEYGRPR